MTTPIRIEDLALYRAYTQTLREWSTDFAQHSAWEHNRRRTGVPCRVCGHPHHEAELQSDRPRCRVCGAWMFVADAVDCPHEYDDDDLDACEYSEGEFRPRCIACGKKG